MVDALAASGEVEADYLQVFNLSAAGVGGTAVQKVVHRQEEPPYRKEQILASDAPVGAKVYVIDDGDHTTMLLAEEY